MLKQMCMNAYLKEAVSVTSLNYQNMGDEKKIWVMRLAGV